MTILMPSIKNILRCLIFFHVSALTQEGKFGDIPFKFTTIINGNCVIYEPKHIEILQLASEFQTTMVSGSRFIWITRFIL